MVMGSNQIKAIAKSGKVYLIEVKDGKIPEKEKGVDYSDNKERGDFKIFFETEPFRKHAEKIANQTIIGSYIYVERNVLDEGLDFTDDSGQSQPIYLKY